MDFTVIARAGLTQVEFAALAGVTRVTVNLWSQGKMKPNRFIYMKIAGLLEILEYAIENGCGLPIAAGIGPLNRPGFIQAAIRDAYQLRRPESVSPLVAQAD